MGIPLGDMEVDTDIGGTRGQDCSSGYPSMSKRVALLWCITASEVQNCMIDRNIPKFRSR